MNIDSAAQEIAITRLTSSIVRKIFRDGKFDVESCNKIVSHIHLMDTTNGSISPATKAQRFEPAPDLRNLQSRIQMSGRSSYLVLQHLMSNPSSWFSTSDLAIILGYTPGSMRVHICSLRKTLRKYGLEDVISTRYRVGYSINKAGVEKVNSFISSND
jgi:DNA-binding response OmpR family regulator